MTKRGRPKGTAPGRGGGIGEIIAQAAGVAGSAIGSAFHAVANLDPDEDRVPLTDLLQGKSTSRTDLAPAVRNRTGKGFTYPGQEHEPERIPLPLVEVWRDEVGVRGKAVVPGPVGDDRFDALLQHVPGRMSIGWNAAKQGGKQAPQLIAALDGGPGPEPEPLPPMFITVDGTPGIANPEFVAVVTRQRQARAVSRLVAEVENGDRTVNSARHEAGIPAASPPRAIGLQQIVVELLDACATDDGVDALKHTHGIPGSSAMNPLSRAIARAVGTDDVWIGDEHREIRVGRGGVTVRVSLPDRLQALLDSMEMRPDLYPGVTKMRVGR